VTVVLGVVVITNNCLSNLSFLAASEHNLNCAKILSLFSPVMVKLLCGTFGVEAPWLL
jgi:hypothetical protein